MNMHLWKTATGSALLHSDHIPLCISMLARLHVYQTCTVPQQTSHWTALKSHKLTVQRRPDKRGVMYKLCDQRKKNISWTSGLYSLWPLTLRLSVRSVRLHTLRREFRHYLSWQIPQHETVRYKWKLGSSMETRSYYTSNMTPRDYWSQKVNIKAGKQIAQNECRCDLYVFERLKKQNAFRMLRLRGQRLSPMS